MESRVETLMKSLLNGTTIDFTPSSRMEEYLKACLNKTGTVGLPNPQSRLDALMYALAEMIPTLEGVGSPELKLQTKEITANGVYQADSGYDAIGTAVVELPNKVVDLITRDIEVLTEQDLQNLHTVGQNAFYGCSFLSRVELPYGVSGIGMNAFRLCSKLDNVTIPQSVAFIRPRGFYGCSSMRAIRIPAMVTELRSSTFYECTALEDVHIDGDIVTVEDNSVFYGCPNLTNFSIKSLKITNNNFKLNYSDKLTVESMVNILNALVDNSDESTKYVVSFGSTNLAKLTDEQKAIAYNKNIDLA